MFVLLLWSSTFVDWFVAKWMVGSKTQTGKCRVLFLSLAVNLGFLGYLKYGAFLINNLTVLLAPLGIAYQPTLLSLLLPVGVSFYTLETLSSTLDVYRGQTPPWKSCLDFALFVAFFPPLVAGPIIRLRRPLLKFWLRCCGPRSGQTGNCLQAVDREPCSCCVCLRPPQRFLSGKCAPTVEEQL
ncbi:MAG TPA: hypothetical protein VNN62_08450 [Methylomirabilota bacterium]|nr:hypothetical protein [Methylomirabilota bacterium]